MSPLLNENVNKLLHHLVKGQKSFTTNSIAGTKTFLVNILINQCFFLLKNKSYMHDLLTRDLQNR
jgi:hypothetical protein